MRSTHNVCYSRIARSFSSKMPYFLLVLFHLAYATRGTQSYYVCGQVWPVNGITKCFFYSNFHTVASSDGTSLARSS